MEKTAAPVTPPIMFAAPPLKNDLQPPSLKIFRMQDKVLSNFTFSPDVIIILLRTVSSGYERTPETIVAKYPKENVMAMFYSYFEGR